MANPEQVIQELKKLIQEEAPETEVRWAYDETKNCVVLTMRQRKQSFVRKISTENLRMEEASEEYIAQLIWSDVPEEMKGDCNG